MLKIKDRKMNDLLRSQIEQQHQRIKMCGVDILIAKFFEPKEEGTYFSTRFKQDGTTT